MTKRIISLVLTVCLLVGLCSALALNASAYPSTHPNTHTNTGDQRADIVAVAQSQLGYAESGGTKYGAWWGEHNNTTYPFTTAAWCAMFVLWCSKEAGITNVYTGRASALCSAWLDSFRGGYNGSTAYNFGSGYMPRPGDLVFVGYAGRTTDHVGLVVGVDSQYIYTIEGNYSDKVSAVQYSMSTGQRYYGSKYILAFGVPNYTNDSSPSFDGPVTSTPEPETPPTETPVNYDVKVTGTTLNVRKGAGTSYAQQSTLYQGQTVSIVAEATASNGALWGKLSTGGWICLTYTQKVTAPEADPNAPAETTPIEPLTIRVTGDNVYIRNNPGSVNTSVIGSYYAGEVVTITETSKLSSGTFWGKTDRGWICLSYTNYDSVIAGGESTAPETPTEPEAPTETPVSYEGKVTASILNVRNAPVDGGILAFLSNGDTVTIVAERDGWGKITTGGWVSLTYIKKIEASTGGTTGGTTTEPGTATSYEGTVTASRLNVRNAPETGSILKVLANGAKVTIVEEKNGWGKLSSGGWVSLTYIKKTTTSGGTTGGTTPETPPTGGSTGTATAITGTITASALNVRNAPGNGGIVSTYYRGTAVTITETKTVNGVQWGKTSAGWISMEYVSTSGTAGGTTGGTTTPETPSTGGTTGTPTSISGTITATALNIRGSAGSGGAIVGTYYKGQSVTITETATVDGVQWGKTSYGWISMEYVGTSGSTGGTTGGTGATTRTVTVTGSSLNIRSAPGTSNAIIGSVTRGMTCTIVAESAGWGQLASGGWISLEYTA